jgi:hypothetical protein
MVISNDGSEAPEADAVKDERIMGLVELVTVARRMHIGTVAWTALLGVVALGGLAFGFWPAVHPGFARADALTDINGHVATVSTTMNEVLANSLEESMRAKLKVRCNSHDEDFRVDLADEINGMEKRYFAITHQGYRQPTCDELQ